MKIIVLQVCTISKDNVRHFSRPCRQKKENSQSTGFYNEGGSYSADNRFKGRKGLTDKQCYSKKPVFENLYSLFLPIPTKMLYKVTDSLAKGMPVIKH